MSYFGNSDPAEKLLEECKSIQETDGLTGRQILLAVGAKGDEFASIKGAMIPKVMQIMGGTH
jgi:hypothetical protein